MQEFYLAAAKALEKAVKQLLSEKHLYQSVEPDFTDIKQVAWQLLTRQDKSPRSTLSGVGGHSSQQTPPDDLIAQGNAIATQTAWLPAVLVQETGLPEQRPIQTRGSSTNPLVFLLPTINTFCDHCQEKWPFNLLPIESSAVVGMDLNACYCLSYQCQNCKKLPVRFLIRREGNKLRLCGRDPIEAIPTPKVLPKGQSKFYGNAVIAHHAGQTLAALFLLRVFIEQYWQSIEAVKALVANNARATGDEQGAEYQKTLPDDFKSRFPSLSDMYGRLSAAMHKADPDAQLFEKSCGEIVEHFDARRLFKFV